MATSPTPAPGGEEPDPSMDDILASIRRILNEDEKTTKPSSAGVLMLDPSMIVEEGESPADGAPIEASLPTGAASTIAAPTRDTDLHLGAEEPLALATMDDTFPPPPVSRDAPPADSPLVAPAAAAAAAHSVGSLVRTLAAERSAAVTRGGLTIEDLVREEVRPVLKEWLDTHLPPLVERMVRAELERVVGRSVG